MPDQATSSSCNRRMMMMLAATTPSEQDVVGDGVASAGRRQSSMNATANRNRSNGEEEEEEANDGVGHMMMRDELQGTEATTAAGEEEAEVILEEDQEEGSNILIHMQQQQHTTNYNNVLQQLNNQQPLPALFSDYNAFSLDDLQSHEQINMPSTVEVDRQHVIASTTTGVKATAAGRRLLVMSSSSSSAVAVQPAVQQQLQMVAEQQQHRSPYRTQMQRESHILAERQRREEMNEKFTVLRSLLPKLTKKDKASIVTDTINYIRELEKKVASLEARRGNKRKAYHHTSNHVIEVVPPKAFDASLVAGDNAILPRTLNLTAPKDSLILIKQVEQDSKISPNIPSQDHSRRVKVGQVEIEDLGSNAVIKVLTTRTRGLVLRMHLALEDCKVEVIQSNVTTVGDNMVHFVTVGLNAGTSATLVELATTLQLAITRPTNVFV